MLVNIIGEEGGLHVYSIYMEQNHIMCWHYYLVLY